MDHAAITQYVTDTFADVDVAVASQDAGSPEVAWVDSFFFYDPDRTPPPDTGRLIPSRAALRATPT